MNSVNIKLTPEQADAIRSGGAVLISVPRPAMTATPSDSYEAERIVREAIDIYGLATASGFALVKAVADALAAQRETLRNAHYEDLARARGLLTAYLDNPAACCMAAIDSLDNSIAELTDGPTEKNS